MIAATYDCGCMPPKITDLHPNCSIPFSPKQNRQITQQTHRLKHTVIRCQTASPPSCPNSSCCNSLSHNSPTCRTEISSCPNFDKIHDCTCYTEPPEISDEINDCCNCGSDDVDNKRIECDPTGKETGGIVSKIVEKGLPYKEIEAIINNNRMVIRMQKELIEDEYEPPCDCPEGPGLVRPKSSTVLEDAANSFSSKYRNDIVYQMQDLCKQGYKCTGQNSMIRQSCDQDGKGGRTIMLYPHPGIKEKLPEISQEEKDKDRRERKEKMKMSKQIDLEENPNIFLFRIRKQSKDNDGRHKFDLEFRTPRPWLPKKEPIKCPQDQSDISQEQKQRDVDETLVKEKKGGDKGGKKKRKEKGKKK